MLRISPRTLQTLRDNRLIACSQINRKFFYKPEEVERLLPLMECYHPKNENIRKTTKKAVKLTTDYRPPLNGERYLTDKEVAERLKVSRRTLQEYRNARQIPFVVFGGKVLYKEHDIEIMLEENYRKAIR